jgi:hypothetical protein
MGIAPPASPRQKAALGASRMTPNLSENVVPFIQNWRSLPSGGAPVASSSNAPDAAEWEVLRRAGGIHSVNPHRVEKNIMDDKDVQRLEDRIAASEERAQLRLEKMMERVDGGLARITDQTTAIRQELHEQRQDSRTLRSELHQQLEEHRVTERTHFHWVIGTTLAVGLGLAALILSGWQIWGSGAQFGQENERYLQETLHRIEDAIHATQPSQSSAPNHAGTQPGKP